MRSGGMFGAALAAVLLAASAPGRAATGDAAPSQMIETAPGVEIRVVDAGPHDAPLTLVLIPGWRFTADIWREQMDAFSDRYRVISLDPRSQGASTKALDGNTPEDRAADLHAILARLHAGPAVLVGWSQGAQDVGAYVGRFGTKGLRGLVFVDAAPAQGVAKALADPAAVERLQNVYRYARYPKEATEGMMQAIFKTPRPKAEHDRLVADALKTPPTIGAAMLEDDLFGPDRMSALAKADIPALLVAADGSPNASDLTALAKVLPKAGPLQPVQGAGHVVFVDKPQAFDAVLGEFLKRL